MLTHHRQGHGEPLLLIHTFWRAWAPVLTQLSIRHQAIAVDLPGFGGSPAIANPSVPAMADAVAALLDQLKLDAVHVAGNSLGASVAVELAARGRVRTLTAIAPLGLGTARENRRTRRRLARVRTLSSLGAPLIPLCARTAIGRTLLAGSGLQLARPWRHERQAMIDTVRDHLRAPGYAEAFDWVLANEPKDLDRIDCPVVVAWGSRDLIASRRQAAHWADRIPGAELRILPGLGHVPMSDDSKGVANLLMETVTSGLAGDGPGTRSRRDGRSRAPRPA
jgi:pimeloyl-ACP methyl ester carboxylesterase